MADVTKPVDDKESEGDQSEEEKPAAETEVSEEAPQEAEESDTDGGAARAAAKTLATLVAALLPGQAGADGADKGEEEPAKEAADNPLTDVERVREIEESASKITADEKDRLTNLQQTLEQAVPGMGLRVQEPEKLVKAIEDERNGIIRDADGKVIKELGGPYFGPATKQAYAALVGFLQEESVPGLYMQLAQSKGPLPVNGPVKLPTYEEGPFKGKVAAPEVFLTQAATGKLKVDLGIKGDRLPSEGDILKLKDVQEWSGHARSVIEAANLEKMQEIARRTIARNGFPPEWKVDTAANCGAAMYAVRNAKETGRLLESLDYLHDKIGGSAEGKREWESLLKDLPAGVIVDREGDLPDGKITKIAFDFPKTLEPSSPEFRDFMRGLHKWCERVREPVDQLMAEHNQAAKKPENTYAWMDVEHPFGYVYMGENKTVTNPANGLPIELKKGDFMPSVSGPPELGDAKNWKHFNLIEMRVEAEEQRNKGTGDLEKVKLNGALRYCDVPLWSYLNLYKPQSEGTDVLHPPDKWREPKEWVAFRETATSTKFMQAKDVQDYADEQQFWHVAGKAVIATMDASMLLGLAPLTVATRTGRAARTAAGTIEVLETGVKAQQAAGQVTRMASLLEKAKSSEAMLRLAQQEIQAASATHKFHAMKQVILGLTAPLNNVAVMETPGLKEAAIVRGLVFMFDISKGTVYDPLKGATRRMLMGPKILSMGEQIYEAAAKGAPTFLRGMEKSGHYGFMATQLPFALEMKRHIGHQLEEYVQLGGPDYMKGARDRLDAANRARDKKLPDEPAYKDDPKVTAKTLADNLDKFVGALKLDGESDARAKELLKELKPLLEPPLDAQGQIDKDKIAEWKAKREKFIAEKLAPVLLASGQQIADAERTRADGLYYDSRAFKDKKTFTSQDIHDQELSGKLNPQNEGMRDFAAAAMILLARGASGELDKFGAANEDKDVLFTRDTQVPPWMVTKHQPAGETTVPVDYHVPRQGETRDPLRQYIRMSDLMTQLEKRLLPSQSADQRIHGGELLARAGLPAEVYASTLKSVIKAPDSTPEQRNEAIIRLAAVAGAIQQNEVVRRGLARDDSFTLDGLAADNSSKELRDFLHKLSKNQSESLDTRVLSRFMVSRLDRQMLSKDDLDSLDNVFQSGQLSYADYVTMMTAVLEKEPKTVADIERKMDAALALSEFLDADGKLLEPPNFKGKLPTAADLNIRLAQTASHANQFETQTTEARKKVMEAHMALANAQGTAGEAAAKAELEKLQKAMAFIETDRLRAAELATKAGDHLLKPVLRDGILRSRITHMDQSDNPDESRAAMEARDDLMKLTKTLSPTLEDVAAKQRLMDILPALLADHDLNLKPDDAKAVREGLAVRRAELSTMLQALLVPELGVLSRQQNPEATAAEIRKLAQDKANAKRQFPAASDSYETKGLKSVWALAQEFPELRAQAIRSLVALNDKSAFTVVKNHVLPEREADPAVRLEAARALTRIAAGGNEQAREVIQEILNRTNTDPRRPPETDAAVVMALQRKYDPVGLGESPKEAAYKKAVEEVATIIEQGAKWRPDIIKLMETKYPWLNGDDLRAKIREAKRGVYGSNGLAYLWDDVPMGPGQGPTGIPERQEMAAQQKVWADFKEKFDKLATTAFENNNKDGKEARELLFAIITSDGAGWNMGADARKQQLDTGWTGQNLTVNRQTFESLRTMAAKSLADCCRRTDNQKPLPDAQLAQLEALLYAGLKDPNAPALAKWHLMRGVEAIADLQTGKDLKRAEMIPARGTAAVMDALKQVLTFDAPSYMTDQEKHSEMRMRQQLALKMLDYVAKHNTSRAAFKQLEAVALVAPGVEPKDDKVPPRVRQRAREIISDFRDRTYPVSVGTKVDSSGTLTKQGRADLLAEAKEAAQYYIADGQATAAGGQVPKDVLHGLQDRQDDLAVNKIYAASKGHRIATADDPVGKQLVDLLQKSNSERVREAAAIAIFQTSGVRAQRDEAIAVMAELASSGSRPGYRKDAEDFLRALSGKDLEAADTALKAVHDKLLAQMTAELKKADKLPAGDDANSLMDAYVQHGQNTLRVQMAVTLSNLGMIHTKQRILGPAENEALAAVNLFRGQPVKTAVPRDEQGRFDWLKLPSELKSKWGNSEYISSVAHAVENWGMAQQGILPNWDDVQQGVRAAQRIRIDTLGDKHRDTISGAQLSTRVDQDKLNEDRQVLTDKKALLDELEKSLKSAQGEEKKTLELQFKDARKEYLDLLNQTMWGYQSLADYQKTVYKMVKDGQGVSARLGDVWQTRAAMLDQAAVLAREGQRLAVTDNEKKYYSGYVSNFEKSAEEAYKAVIDFRLKLTKSTADEIAGSRRQLTALLWRQERYADAKIQLEETARLYPGNNAKAAPVYADLARVNLKLADEAAAQAAFKRINDINDHVYGPKSTQAASARLSEAQIRSEFKQWGNAIAAQKAAIDVLKAQDSLALAGLYYRLAEIQFAAGKRPEMIDSLSKAVSMRQKLAPAEDATAEQTAVLARWQAATGNVDAAVKTINDFKQTLSAAKVQNAEFSVTFALQMLNDMAANHQGAERTAILNAVKRLEAAPAK